MADRKNTHGLSVRTVDDVTIVDLGQMEVWDGADLSLLRDSLTGLARRDRCQSIAINMSFVQVLPTGFFGTLYDCFEAGISVRLLSPHTRVRSMVWFRQFFVEDSGDVYELRDAASRLPATTLLPQPRKATEGRRAWAYKPTAAPGAACERS